MKITALEIEGAWVADSPIWSDNRGFFSEWFKLEEIKNLMGRDFIVEQANVSSSSKGTLRGIHYSLAIEGQAKWITCLSGSIRDVVVDIRPNSKTFGKWISIELSGGTGKSLLISEYLGHGFLSLEENSVVAYLVSSAFSPDDEYGINPMDKSVGIDWGIDSNSLNMSEKDKNAPNLYEQMKLGKLPN
jgi:dTDP-4-dehydrorhamnose 3,5-epimerase